ncbi:hypothetical protein [Microbacterium sp. RU33B]|uniref:hypothetical protein n=1 Tax=Microbacterium sp. RU33B TaxID=1907390 RepID=UPI0009605242|nr:hypothetical protein [Microbacterium sp. RU33B]SIT73616.1 hypothetical protein SAMN05880545_1247 [Microbacterium sp. RU33B]
MTGEATPADLWDSDRPELVAIRWEAARRIASPWAVLSIALTHSLLTIPYTVRYRSELHPEGTPLNLAIAIVGRSGAGKSTATNAAAHAVRYLGADALPEAIAVRSGEAIPTALAFMHTASKDAEPELKWRRADHAIWAHWEEVGMLAAQGARTGSTMLDAIKSVTSGERIGGQNSRGDGLTIPTGSYRAVVTVAVQPRLSAPLLNDAAVSGGLSGRFLWTLAEDPAAASVPRPRLPTEHVSVDLTHWDGVRYVDALPVMDAAHDADTRAAHRGERDPINSRALLIRSVVSIALANMNGRASLDSEDWRLAGAVLAHSEHTRAAILRALAEPDPQELAADRLAESYVIDRVADLRARGLPWRQVESQIAKSKRDTFKSLLAAGRIERW